MLNNIGVTVDVARWRAAKVERRQACQELVAAENKVRGADEKLLQVE